MKAAFIPAHFLFKVANPKTGKSTLAYAQLDTALQATLILDELKMELDLESIPDPMVTL